MPRRNQPASFEYSTAPFVSPNALLRIVLCVSSAAIPNAAYSLSQLIQKILSALYIKSSIWARHPAPKE